jgi:hypothetical protein
MRMAKSSDTNANMSVGDSWPGLHENNVIYHADGIIPSVALLHVVGMPINSM